MNENYFDTQYYVDERVVDINILRIFVTLDITQDDCQIWSLSKALAFWNWLFLLYESLLGCKDSRIKVLRVYFLNFLVWKKVTY